MPHTEGAGGREDPKGAEEGERLDEADTMLVTEAVEKEERLDVDGVEGEADEPGADDDVVLRQHVQPLLHTSRPGHEAGLMAHATEETESGADDELCNAGTTALKEEEDDTERGGADEEAVDDTAGATAAEEDEKVKAG